MKKLSKTVLYFILSVVYAGCVPKFYVIDKPTVFEAEASGQWPDVNQNMRTQIAKKGATFLKTREKSEKRDRAMNNLSGEMVESHQAPTSSKK